MAKLSVVIKQHSHPTCQDPKSVPVVIEQVCKQCFFFFFFFENWFSFLRNVNILAASKVLSFFCLLFLQFFEKDLK